MVARIKNDSYEIVKSGIGGKAYNLNKIKKAGLNIPSFFVISSRLINDFISSIGITKESIDVLYTLDSKRVLSEISKLRKKIISAQITREMEDFIIKSMSGLKTNKIIVRSSALNEDSLDYSFAGIFDSRVTIRDKNELTKSVKIVIASLFSEKIYFYVKNSNIDQPQSIAIILQEFIDGNVSGVLFTSIRKNDKKLMVINSNYGTAKSVVDGDKSEEFIINESHVIGSADGKSLSVIEINGLVKIGKKLELLFKNAQDIEWTIKDSKIYILQSRPITNEFSEEIRIWDNSNIAESYSGIVLPLTASYARHIYEITYKDLARRSGVSERKIKDYNNVFENLLGFLHGRFYYNMLNWYRMLTLFPGYERNKVNLDYMISAKSRAELNEEYKNNVSTLFKIKYYLILVKRYPFFEKEVGEFKKHVKDYLSNFNKLNLGNMTNKGLIEVYYKSVKELLDRWSITVENDFLLMTFFGKFRDFCKQNDLEDDEILRQISGIRNVISAKQVDSLRDIAKDFRKHKNLMALAKNKKYNKCYQEIKNNESYAVLNKGIDDYLERYGGRFANELRLEAEDFVHNPDYLVKLIYNYSKSETLPQTKEQLRKNLNLSIIKRMKFNYLLGKVKHYTKRREELRLLRSQSFSLARNIFSEIGKNFENQDVLDNSKDIFYLEVSEIKQFIEGSSTTPLLKEMVILRKDAYQKFAKRKIESVLSTEGDPYPFLELRSVKDSINQGGVLRGQGCSSGIVKGKVKILESFKLPDEEGYDIVVTKHTDPGWTPLFGLSKGFIVEHGGLLSHAAIISRELNMPCVIGVKNATKKLKDGQVVTINGNTGEVIIHD